MYGIVRIDKTWVIDRFAQTLKKPHRGETKLATKYSIAKEVLEQVAAQAQSEGVAEDEVQEALMILIIQNLAKVRDAGNVKSLLQYEMDSLSSGGVYEIQRR